MHQLVFLELEKVDPLSDKGLRVIEAPRSLLREIFLMKSKMILTSLQVWTLLSRYLVLATLVLRWNLDLKLQAVFLTSGFQKWELLRSITTISKQRRSLRRKDPISNQMVSAKKNEARQQNEPGPKRKNLLRSSLILETTVMTLQRCSVKFQRAIPTVLSWTCLLWTSWNQTRTQFLLTRSIYSQMKKVLSQVLRRRKMLTSL